MPKIHFIQPTQYDRNGNLCKQKSINLPGLAFPLLASMTPDNWDISLTLEVVEDVDFNSDADLIAIGTMGHSIFRAIEIAGKYKEKGKTTILGGYMASLAEKQIGDEVDSVLVGDAERSYPIMLADFERHGKIKRRYDYPVQDISNLPVPNYELLTAKPIGNMLPVQAGRGCPFSCSFCSIACLYKGKYLFRPVDEVIRDIKIIKQLGFKRFYLIDDNIASNQDYLKELCSEIKKLNMNWASQCALHIAANQGLIKEVADSGCDLMSFGVESISQEGLDKLNKPWLKTAKHEEYIKTLSKSGIAVSSEMILGTDSDTEESIRETYRFIQKNKVPIPRFYILTPVPGTDLYMEMKREGILLTEDLKEFDGARCVHKPANISPEKLDEMYWWLNNKVFSIGSILARTIFNVRLWNNLKILLLSLMVNLHYRRYVVRGTPPNIF